MRGHPLHARCSSLLVAGEPCPTCAEPLWVPGVRRHAAEADADTCCGGGDEGGAAAAAARAGGRGRGRGGRGRDGGRAHRERRARARRRRIEALHGPRMCPACFAARCSTSNAPTCARTTASARAARPAAARRRGHRRGARQGGRRARARRRAAAACARRDVAVLFNGRTEGHLFADTDWHALPAWDETAKAKLELDARVRGAASLLAAPVRQEAALLAHERGALHDARTSRFAGTRK